MQMMPRHLKAPMQSATLSRRPCVGLVPTIDCKSELAQMWFLISRLSFLTSNIRYKQLQHVSVVTMMPLRPSHQGRFMFLQEATNLLCTLNMTRLLPNPPIHAYCSRLSGILACGNLNPPARHWNRGLSIVIGQRRSVVTLKNRRKSLEELVSSGRSSKIGESS
ncbi:hypothetical protein CRV24_004073 [Beauveria bassiana]|nr:hypothetical protein CRV24_004073 [Beauveria bassiana]